MRRRLRQAGTLIVATAVAVSVSGLAARSAAPAHATAGGTLLVARDIRDAKTMDPGRFYEFTSGAMATNCYDTLVTFKGTDTTHPQRDLATTWSISGGGKVFTFHVRHDVRFANGDPMTADDVVFSYRRLEYLKDNPAFLVSGATDIRALDKYTVRITLGAPDISFLAALADPNFGVLDSRLVKAHGGDDSPQAKTRDTATHFLDGQSAGTGAFQMTTWRRNNQIVLVRNPYYWGPRSPMDKIIFQNVPDAATQRLLVQKGSVDIADEINLQQAQELRNNPNVQLITGNTLDLVYVAMTTSAARSKALSDKRVRQAIRYAIDYDGILKGLLKGVGTRPNSMIPVGMLGNDAATNNALLVHQDLARARALLKAAGYAHGFSVKLTYDVGVTFDGVLFDPIAAKLQNDLARVGIHLVLQPQQDSVLLPSYRAQKLQMVLYNWGVDFPDPNDYAGPFSPGGGPAKRVFYTWDKHLTDVVTQADSTSDRAQRAALYRTVQQTWLDEGPWIALVQPQNIIVLARSVKGYTYSPILPHNFRTVSR
jgi:peptide/nickel transport system substrate-binding protein